MKRKLKIIFHHPLPIGANNKSASGIRPQKMLRAFQELGHEVEVVGGYAPERKKKIREIKEKMAAGKKYDFAYAESSTMPTSLSDPNHMPWHLFLDFSLFQTLSRNQVPIGLFYRDIYWRFKNYDKKVKGVKNTLAKAFYWWDLIQYRKFVTILYLPSARMAAYIPLIPARRTHELPPGLTAPDARIVFFSDIPLDQPLRLLYIGGVSEHYKLHELFRVVRSREDVFLTICTRKQQWREHESNYLPDSPPNVKIVHKEADQIEDLYQEADLTLLFVEPGEYRDFAMPFKLFEYIGHRKPIIASEGTAAGDFVNENKVGWTIPYKADALNELLSRINENRKLIEVAADNCAKIFPNHTWEARAQKVIQNCLERSEQV